MACRHQSKGSILQGSESETVKANENTRKQWLFVFGAILTVTTLVLLFVSFQPHDGGFLLGKSMTFMTLLGLGATAAMFMKSSYSSQEGNWCGKVCGKISDKICLASKNTTDGFRKLTNKSGGRSFLKFFYSSKTFWVSLLCIVLISVASVAGSWTGNSLLMKTGTIFASGLFLLCALYIGVRRCIVYQKGTGDHEAWGTDKTGAENFGNKLIPSCFVILAILGAVLAVMTLLNVPGLASLELSFGGNGTGAIFSVLVLLTVGIGGYFSTKKAFFSDLSCTSMCATKEASTKVHVDNESDNSSDNSDSSTRFTTADNEQKHSPVSSREEGAARPNLNDGQTNGNVLRNEEVTRRRRLAALENMLDTLSI